MDMPCTGQQGKAVIEGTVGNTSIHGLVSLCDGMEWRAVCARGWDMNAARVLCRQLGFPEQGNFHLFLKHSSIFVPTDSMKEPWPVEDPVLV